MSPHSPLKRAIFDSGQPQIVIARRAGIHEARLSKLARGHEQPKDEEKKALAKVLRVPVSTLFPDMAAAS